MQNGGIQSEDWVDNASQPSSHGSDRVNFNGDGLNTGVRVLSAILADRLVPY